MSLFVLDSKLEVPFLLEEMREDTHAEWSELVEDIRKKCSIVHFEVKTSLVGQPHDLSKDEAHILDEKRIDEGINNFCVAISRMLIQNDLVLHKEVRNVVIQIDSLGNCIDTYHFSTARDSETEVLGRRIES